MISYKVFNQLTGKYQDANDLDEAKILQTKLINDYFSAQLMFQDIKIEGFLKNEKAIASEFLAIKLGIPEIQYLYTNYNATTKQDISHVFLANDNDKKYLVKVADDSVTEWYESDREVNGVVRTWVSLDVDTDEPIEYYVGQPNNANFKYDLNDNFLVATYFCIGLNGIPEDKLSLLSDFKYSDHIGAYSDKSYGFIIEYFNPGVKTLNEATAEEISILELQKEEWVSNNLALFQINKIEVDSLGNETWVPILMATNS